MVRVDGAGVAGTGFFFGAAFRGAGFFCGAAFATAGLFCAALAGSAFFGGADFADETFFAGAGFFADAGFTAFAGAFFDAAAGFFQGAPIPLDESRISPGRGGSYDSKHQDRCRAEHEGPSSLREGTACRARKGCFSADMAIANRFEIRDDIAGGCVTP